MRRILVLMLIVLALIGFKLPGVCQFPTGLPFNSMAADYEAGSPEEFEAVVLNAVKEVRDVISIRIKPYNEEDYNIATVLDKLLDEDAGLGFVSGCSSRVSRAFGSKGAVVELSLHYNYPREKVISMRELARSRANEIVESIVRDGISEYEKVLAVHDYIVKNSSYDRINADSNTLLPEEHEAYGVLVEGRGVCDSYAKAVKLLLDKAGVECLLVKGSKAGSSGQNMNETDHAWNIVKIDGEYYHMDTTWDDMCDDWDSTEVLHHFMNLSDLELQKTHIWDRSRYPACTGTKFNYFRYNGLIAENKAETLSLMVKAISRRQKRLTVKISDYDSTEHKIEELIKTAVERCGLRQEIGVEWITNDSLGIIEMKLNY